VTLIERRASVRQSGRFRLTVRRVWAHLTRYTARWAYLLAAICIVIYALVPEEWAAADPIKQFVLILSSVAVGAVVLPELPSNLWTIDVERVRNLIPGAQRETLARSLISAESTDQRWNDLVWSKALEPLLAASRNPSRYVRDMDYDVAVHLNRDLELATGVIPVHSVSVDQKSTRVIGESGHSALWISIARTLPALSGEFDQKACLAREVVPLGDITGAEWQNAIIEHCRAELFIDGARIELYPDTTSGSTDLVRWRTHEEYELPTGWVKVRVLFDFHLDTAIDTFPVIFAGYYCAGTTDVSLRLYDEKQPSVLDCDSFVGRALEEGAPPSTLRSDNGIYQHVAFSTGKDGILWPGSGVMFRWSPRP